MFNFLSRDGHPIFYRSKISKPPSRLSIFVITFVLIFSLTACAPEKPNPSIDLAPTKRSADFIITLHYNERPPYLIKKEDGVTGLTGQPATNAFEQSGIPYRWVQTPTQRQLYILQQNSGRDCFVGWFKTAERVAYAKYSLPIYQDHPQIGLARSDNQRIPPISTIKEIFSDPSLTLLIKAGYSYGESIDGMIKEYQPERMETTVESSAMLKIISAQHADYFFTAPEEAFGLIESADFNQTDFKHIQFSDAPPGEYRYIMCSKQVEDDIIDHLNSVLIQYDLNAGNIDE